MDYSHYAGHQSQPYSLYGLPTPDQQPQSHNDDALRDPFTLNAYNNQYFPGFDPSFRLDPSTSLVPPPHSPPDSFTKHSVSSNDVNHTKTDPASIDGDEPQSKRKAQNRAAQRAFRERKERHVRDLEDKVNSLEEASKSLQADNERLKRELAKYATENEILRATSRSNHNPQEPPRTNQGTASSGSGVTVPGAGSPHRVTVCQVTGEKLLDAGDTWDLIQSHELFKRGQVDIGDVSERLKGLAQCNGQGPAFKESEVRRAIEESAAGRDELI
ncbi:uncharacterized protein N7477_000631 [Penicillium maclennaniae]|uniref:uncharacterized protein n=1 Tax=Penicillium maclennaniae TaxID=1343394 RepID=UPI0025411621|nr:uncharacterized protein N7477_000631 [Penicillium maclennaniae]KAJ5684286.1 hypothetical protein N7477_000631 [Penicillium maclennaniae]